MGLCSSLQGGYRLDILHRRLRTNALALPAMLHAEVSAATDGGKTVGRSKVLHKVEQNLKGGRITTGASGAAAGESGFCEGEAAASSG